jgi:hypothetical protein
MHPKDIIRYCSFVDQFVTGVSSSSPPEPKGSEHSPALRKTNREKEMQKLIYL